MSLELIITKRTDSRLLERMKNHYSQPKGFVGRSICYAIYYDKRYYCHIIAGSATRFLPGRNEYLNITLDNLNNVINNIFYNISKVEDKYPTRNFTTKVLQQFMIQSTNDWITKYGDNVIGFESLIEKPRTGDLYLKAGWEIVCTTKGYTCKRVSGQETGKFSSGKRVWNTTDLRPKLVLCYKLQ